MKIERTRFSIGQPIHHRLFDYRGVIFNLDATFQGEDEWYDLVAKSRPPKDKPWYHVLVHGAVHTTYVSEQNLEPDLTGQPVEHPAMSYYFGDFRDGIYQPHEESN